MHPIASFDDALKRAKHLLILYDILHDSRRRAVRRDWASRFKDIMHWPESERIHRVDGKDQNSILILRGGIGMDRAHFAHEYLSELLRASIVASVSALDRYLHDIVLHHCIRLLGKREDDIPRELSKLSISILATKRSLEALKANKNARPGHILKKAIQEHLHSQYTFQNPDAVQKAAQMLGIDDLWTRISAKMAPHTRKDIIDRLRVIVQRRNRIVHEADLIRKTKGKKLTLREVKLSEAQDILDWINNFVRAIDDIIRNT